MSMIHTHFVRFLLLTFGIGFIVGSTAKAQIPAQANQYRARLKREAHAKWGLTAPVSVFAAQIHQESRWRDDAKSPVGALGIAQFMPGSAKWISQLYPADLGANQPLDAAWAIRALVFYDKYLYDRLPEFKVDGLHRMGAVLSAYNGGLGWVNKDRKLVLSLPLDKRPELCDNEVSRYFWCVAENSARNAAAFAENKSYPVKILFQFEPVYRKAGW